MKHLLEEFEELILNSKPKTDEELLDIYNEAREKGIEHFEVLTEFIRTSSFERFEYYWRCIEDYIHEEDDED